MLLDTFAADFDNQYFEAAVSVAASICMSERQNEALLDLMFVGKTAHRFTSGRGVDHMPHIQEVLATVEKSTEDFSQLKKAVINHIHACSSMVCVFISWDEQRKDLVKIIQQSDLPVAVFLIHDGSMSHDDLEEHKSVVQLVNYNNIAADLGAT